jgi:hypothetical protein
MNKMNKSQIEKIKNEIESLLKEINEKEEVIVEKVGNNTNDILLYKTYLESVIEEYHLVCKKIYG